MNTWPDGVRRALDQNEHESWNSWNYPGTRELCCTCAEPTGRCEEDNIFIEQDDGDVIGPLCEQCYDNINSAIEKGQ